jgi:hypothetical protein
MKIVCECCGWQILPGSGTPDRYVTYRPVRRWFASQYICGHCTHDLDENGLFPEEREEAKLLATEVRRSVLSGKTGCGILTEIVFDKRRV